MTMCANVDEDNTITDHSRAVTCECRDLEGDDLVASNLTLVMTTQRLSITVMARTNYSKRTSMDTSMLPPASAMATPVAANLGLTVDPKA
ncbi:hypothetical protein OK016_22120 [Vibrio chagasii]|nr:hypothetical protein [Vibrio chagasii]